MKGKVLSVDILEYVYESYTVINRNRRVENRQNKVIRNILR